MTPERIIRAGVLHGAGYVGAELIQLLLAHPFVTLDVVTSTSQAGQSLASVHPSLTGRTSLMFTDSYDNADGLDVVFIAAGHGKGATAVKELHTGGYAGKIIDMSADFRLKSVNTYEVTYGVEHPIPTLLDDAVYGLPELTAVTPLHRLVANPGCFATGLSLALTPLARAGCSGTAHVTALTGASGSGNRPSPTTHYPTRDGNVRAYRIFNHRHLAEVDQFVGDAISVSFVPVSGPWTRGIWGTIHFQSTGGRMDSGDLSRLFESAYGDKPFVRLWPGVLPELRFSLGTPFCDIGWIGKDDQTVIGFALDNLLKGAASQAIQNMNLITGLPETTGLLPEQIPCTNQ